MSYIKVLILYQNFFLSSYFSKLLCHGIILGPIILYGYLQDSTLSKNFFSPSDSLFHFFPFLSEKTLSFILLSSQSYPPTKKHFSVWTSSTHIYPLISPTHTKHISSSHTQTYKLYEKTHQLELGSVPKDIFT